MAKTATSTIPHYATLDAINALHASGPYIEGFTVNTDTGASANIYAIERLADGRIAGYARYYRTNLLVRFVQTGKVPRNGWAIRCKVYVANDTGDLAGTLVFAGADDDNYPNGIGGVFNAILLTKV